MTDTNIALNESVPLSVDGAKAALRQVAQRHAINPLVNSVFSLAVRYFQQLEQNECTPEELEALAKDVGHELLNARVDRLRTQHRIDGSPSYPEIVTARLDAIAAEGFDAFKTAVERERGGIVFTGHPTFALPQTLRAAMATTAVDPNDASQARLHGIASEDSSEWAQSISLDLEHGEVQATLENAQIASRQFVRRIATIAQQAFPQQWRTLRPTPPTLASWVGYDLDGRADIQWYDSITLRLKEKSTQLTRYSQLIRECCETHGANTTLAELSDRLEKAAALTDAQMQALAAANNDPSALVHAANLITADHEDRLTNISHITDVLTQLIEAPDTAEELAVDLISLRSLMDTVQLGTGRIHLRLNAAQMTSVMKRDLGMLADTAEIGRVGMNALAEKTRLVQETPVSFADLYFEQTTARRQFMMCSMLLHHVDEGSPIRFLIAESESPATVLYALYLARLYGVADHLDISPLFETPHALITGARLMERLLEEDVFTDYVSKRGYMSIQLGFSDAGRFVGQVTADMAIERLHNLIGRALSKKACGFDLLVFNTHGESMGRGAFPGTFEQRLDHCLTPWTRLQNENRGVKIRHEVSFQGGDGFLHYANEPLADATYAAVCSHFLTPVDPAVESDAYYLQTDFVWDFYRALKAWQEDLLQRPEYDNLLSDFAGGFLVRAGSRKTRRGGARGPRALRAISHNATLQQLSVPLNIACGIGSAMPNEVDRLLALINGSPRMQHLVSLALAARRATSVPSLRAYASVYSPNLWIGLAQQSDDDKTRQNRYLSVHRSLVNTETTQGVMQIADALAADLIAFDSLLENIDFAPSMEDRHEDRLPLHILHAVRQALMMRAFTVTANLPAFSDRHGVNVDEIIDMIHMMQFDDAISALRNIFPAARDPERAFDNLTHGHAEDPSVKYGYDDVHQDVIEPLEEISRILRSISLWLCHAYGAYG